MSGGSRRKGAAFERTVAKRFAEVAPNSRRGLGQSRGGGSEVADVETPYLHIECKASESVSIYDALAQAKRDAKPGMVPTVVLKRNRQTPVVIIELDEFMPVFDSLVRGGPPAALVARKPLQELPCAPRSASAFSAAVWCVLVRGAPLCGSSDRYAAVLATREPTCFECLKLLGEQGTETTEEVDADQVR